MTVPAAIKPRGRFGRMPWGDADMPALPERMRYSVVAEQPIDPIVPA